MPGATHSLLVPVSNYDLGRLSSEVSNWASRCGKQLKPRSMERSTFSRWHEDSLPYTSLNVFVVNAIVNYCKDDESSIGLVRVGTYGNAGTYASECTLPDGKTFIFTIDNQGRAQGALRDEASGRHVQVPTISRDSNFDLASIYLCILLRVCEEDPDLSSKLSAMALQYQNTAELDELSLYLFSDAIENALRKDVVKCVMTGGDMDLLSQSRVNNKQLTGELLCGNPRFIVDETIAGQTETIPFARAKSMFSTWAKSMKWSDEEKLLIPSFPDDFAVMPETIKMCSRYVKTHNDRRPMVNWMWRGVTSYGKSTGVEVMAALLNMPLLRLTCFSGMETQDFLSRIVPVEKDDSQFQGELPEPENMVYDPANTYFDLTGTQKDDATPSDCLKAYTDIVISRTKKESGQLLKNVKSTYVEALEHGYIVEVQEFSRIKDSGVLVGLNEFDRPGAWIPLVDGSKVRRHPNAIVVFTDNAGYSSCRPVDPSVIRRAAFVIDSNELPKDDVLNRVKYNTGFDDEVMLLNMYDVWLKVQEYCRDKDITEGSVSVTELEMWCQCVIADEYGHLRDNCIDCVVSKATSVPEEQREILSAVVDTSLYA